MDKIYNRMRRLLPVANNEQTTNNKQHPKNRAFQISFVGLFVLLLLKSGVWQLCIVDNFKTMVCPITSFDCKIVNRFLENKLKRRDSMETGIL